ncbi:MAG TPA: Kdo hydroxylase family protein [Tepidisphaeraceae bacterium]|jgi:hypothetical protein
MENAAPITKVSDYQYPQGWPAGADADERARHYCAELEAGNIILFDTIPFDLPEADRTFLLSQKQSGFKAHKNVSYRPAQDLVRGAAEDDPQEAQRLHELMRNYSNQVVQFLSQFLAPYASKWTVDFATWRPLEEKNRDLPIHKRNDLLHVDAFHSRPTHGNRILRCFTNINPERSRVWATTAGFETLAERFALDAGLDQIARQAGSPLGSVKRGVGRLLKSVGVRGADRSAYDAFMLRFHDYLKESTDYQQKWDKFTLEFPPFSTWMVFTDSVPHAALSGQYALEQTFIIPVKAMVEPQKSPIRVLEALCGQSLAN